MVRATVAVSLLLIGCGSGDIDGAQASPAPEGDAAIADTTQVEAAVEEDTATPPPLDAACTMLRDKCAAASECCEGNACEVTPIVGGGAPATRCCRDEGSSCAETDDCCGYLRCSSGKCGRRAAGDICGVDSDCTTNKCTAGRCVDPSGTTTGYRIPLTCGGPYNVTQGNFDTKCTVYSHTDKAKYAYDFGVGLNTPVLAMRAGDVIMVKNDIRPGNPCYSGGGSACANQVNYVVIKHDDGFGTIYLHLNEAKVAVGAKVAQGQLIGLSGGTGWSTGPHMHVQKQELCGSWWCQSVPLVFDEYASRLDCGMKVTSQNGC